MRWLKDTIKSNNLDIKANEFRKIKSWIYRSSKTAMRQNFQTLLLAVSVSNLNPMRHILSSYFNALITSLMTIFLYTPVPPNTSIFDYITHKHHVPRKNIRLFRSRAIRKTTLIIWTQNTMCFISLVEHRCYICMHVMYTTLSKWTHNWVGASNKYSPICSHWALCLRCAHTTECMIRICD